jgi:hypothetical protein
MAPQLKLPVRFNQEAMIGVLEIFSIETTVNQPARLARIPCSRQVFFVGGGAFAPLLLLGPPLFNHSFQVHHPVNRDDQQHLLAHAMTSDFSVEWEFLTKRAIGFCVTDQTPRP